MHANILDYLIYNNNFEANINIRFCIWYSLGTENLIDFHTSQTAVKIKNISRTERVKTISDWKK